MRKYVLTGLFIYLCNGLWAQIEYIGSIRGNSVLLQFQQDHPGFDFKKDGSSSQPNLRSSLTLPFFDDFTFKGPLPDKAKWSDPYVYINNHYAILPPSYGVASFDDLNWNGMPYRGIVENYYTASDTLTSQPIGLSLPGSKPKDSIYLSFFLEPQGFDPDPLYNIPSKYPQDTFTVDFYGKDSIWHRVWSIAGIGLPVNFKQYLIPIKDSTYFHDQFRFRFVNYSRQTGQANHWHLDYVYVNKTRSISDTLIEDFAIVYEGLNLLKNYYSMPFRQFDSRELKDSTHITVRNLFSAVKLPVGKHIYNDSLYNQLHTPDQNTFYNIPGYTTANLAFPVWTGIANLTPADKMIITRQWQITTPGDKTHNNNDTIAHSQIFSNYLAYDDGTAEGSYGLVGNLGPNGGKVAQKFRLLKADSMWGISIFFAQCSTATTKRPLKLAVWQSLTPGSGGEVLLKTINIPKPTFLEGMNHFADFTFDQPIALDTGTFYVGWIQTSKDTLLVGQDMNYSQWNADTLNRNVYYQVLGKWYQSNKATGALMIRPYIGPNRSLPVFLGQTNTIQPDISGPTVLIYPNPTVGLVKFQTENGGLVDVVVYNMEGRMVFSGNQLSQVDLSDFEKGAYILKITDSKSRRQVFHTVIKD